MEVVDGPGPALDYLESEAFQVVPSAEKVEQLIDDGLKEGRNGTRLPLASYHIQMPRLNYVETLNTRLSIM